MLPRRILPYRMLSILLIALSCVIFQPTFMAHAATFNVGCDADSATRTTALINAITSANASPDDDTINLTAECTYILATTDNVTNGNNGLPSILSVTTSGKLTINGNDATITRDSNAPDFRIFHVASDADFTLNELKVVNGKISGTDSQNHTGDGGGIFSTGNLIISSSAFSENSAISGGGLYSSRLGALTVSDSFFSENKATGSTTGGGGIFTEGIASIHSSTFSLNTSETYGGGIVSYGATTSATDGLEIFDSTFSRNKATLLGGGFGNVGSAIVFNSSFTDNEAFEGAAIGNAFHADLILNTSTLSNNTAARGGGIFNTTTHSLDIVSSTISGNTATSEGGGVFNLTGTFSIKGSIIVNNTAALSGGGVTNCENYSYCFLNIQNSTIANNSATNSGGGIQNSNVGTITLTHTTITGNNAYRAGGVQNYGSATLANTLIAANTASSGPDFYGVITSQGYNLIGNSNLTSGLIASDLKDASATPLNLGTLANNGGLTQTIALLAGSVAINRGNPAFIPPPDTDQRGTGFPRVQSGRIDIGAFELIYADLTIQLTLQGRAEAPNEQWETSTQIQIRLPQSTTPLRTIYAISNSSGVIHLSQLPVGTFDLWIKGAHTLARVHLVTLEYGENDLTTALLFEGDGNSDNLVSLNDFSLLASRFGTVISAPEHNGYADFNQDKVVSVIDFSLLASNFGQVGTP